LTAWALAFFRYAIAAFRGKDTVWIYSKYLIEAMRYRSLVRRTDRGERRRGSSRRLGVPDAVSDASWAVNVCRASDLTTSTLLGRTMSLSAAWCYPAWEVDSSGGDQGVE
jgi:hypothetical protein